MFLNTAIIPQLKSEGTVFDAKIVHILSPFQVTAEEKSEFCFLLYRSLRQQ